MSITNTKMANTAMTMASSPGAQLPSASSARLSSLAENSKASSSDTRNPDIVSASAAVELKKPNYSEKIISLTDKANSVTPIFRKISFLVAAVTSSAAALASLIFGKNNFIRKGVEFLATQSINLSLGWIAGITGVIDQLRNKDLPMVLIQLGDSLATLLSPIANKTMNRGLWIGLMNITNFLKQYIPEHADYSNFGESLTATGKAFGRYLKELQNGKSIFNGINASWLTIAGSALYLITGNKTFAPIIRHIGGATAEVPKVASGLPKLANAGASMLSSSTLDALGQMISEDNPNLGQALSFASQALNNYGRRAQLESQMENELGHSRKPVPLLKALGQGLKDFFDLSQLFAYFNTGTIPVVKMKSNGHANNLTNVASQVSATNTRPRTGFHASSSGFHSGGFGRTSARPVAGNNSATNNNANSSGSVIETKTGQTNEGGIAQYTNNSRAGDTRLANNASGSVGASSNSSQSNSSTSTSQTNGQINTTVGSRSLQSSGGTNHGKTYDLSSLQSSTSSNEQTIKAA